MRPPDGPPGPNESDWAHVIQIELNSWDPRLLSPRFQPRRRQRAIPVLRPLPLALVTFAAVALAATVLAGGPRALSLAIVHLASGRPQPTATPAPAPHRAGAGGAPSIFGPGSGSVSGGPLGTPTPGPAKPGAQPADSSAAATGSGAPNQAGAAGSTGAGQPPATAGQEQLPPPSQHQGAPVPNAPPDSHATLPTWPTLPPVRVMPPAHPTQAPSTPPTQR